MEFLIPYPQLDVNISHFLAETSSVLRRFWQQPNEACKIKVTNTNETNFFAFDTIHLMTDEAAKAELDIKQLKKDFEVLLPDKHALRREKRNAALAAGAVGLFTAGMTIGTVADCFIRSVIGTKCTRELSEENARRISTAITHMLQLNTTVYQLSVDTNDKFFLVAQELANLRTTQLGIEKDARARWTNVQAQVDLLTENLRHLLACDNYMIVRTQLNANAAELLSLANAVYANLKTFRLALHNYRTLLLQSIDTLIDKRLPMALVPKTELTQILRAVAIQQIHAGDRLSLAIPTSDILSYYEAQLVQNVSPTEQGLLLTIAVPLASATTVLNVFQAIPLPMPDVHAQQTAHVWDIEAKYLAVSENSMEIALISEETLASCIGSADYAICRNAFATERTRSSCLATLYFGTTHDAIKACRLRQQTLPLTEQAKNLGHGRWLITSASDNYMFRETSTILTGPQQAPQHKGCRACIMVLGCNRQLEGPNVHIRSDLSTCNTMKPTRFDLNLTRPLSDIFNTLPELVKLPRFPTLVAAQNVLYEEVQKAVITEDIRHPTTIELKRIAQPFIARYATHEIYEKAPTHPMWHPLLLNLLCTTVLNILFIIGYMLFKKYNFGQQIVHNTCRKPKTLTQDEQLLPAQFQGKLLIRTDSLYPVFPTAPKDETEQPAESTATKQDS